jgi:hypothetical protein
MARAKLTPLLRPMSTSSPVRNGILLPARWSQVSAVYLTPNESTDGTKNCEREWLKNPPGSKRWEKTTKHEAYMPTKLEIIKKTNNI